MKHRKTLLYVGSIFVLPFVLTVFLLLQADSATSAIAAANKGSSVARPVAPQVNSSLTPVAPTAPPPVVPANAAKLSSVKGVAAIKVTNANALTNGNGAKFSEADVRQFLSSQPQWGMIKSVAPFTIEKVEFLTAREVKARINQDVATMMGVADTTSFCLMTGRGSFVMAAGPPLPGQPQTSNTGATFQRAYQLYDAQTGNLIMMGGLGN